MADYIVRRRQLVPKTGDKAADELAVLEAVDSLRKQLREAGCSSIVYTQEHSTVDVEVVVTGEALHG